MTETIIIISYIIISILTAGIIVMLSKSSLIELQEDIESPLMLGIYGLLWPIWILCSIFLLPIMGIGKLGQWINRKYL